MKKLIAILFVILMLCACAAGGQNEEPPEDIKILTEHIYKTEDGRYGLHTGGEIISHAAGYDVIKEIGTFGERTLYACGKKDGTRPCIIYDADSRASGIGETERIIYDIVFSDGNLLLSIPADDFEFLDGTLSISLEGSLYEYKLSESGEIIGENSYPVGKTGEVCNGYCEVGYYYGASGITVGKGLCDADGNEVIPAIYTEIYGPLKGTILAKSLDGFGMWNICRIYDSEGNVVCEKYHDVEYYTLPENRLRYIGIAQCASPQSQVASVCRDENGEIMPGGFWFVDQYGNPVSERFDLRITDEINFDSEESVIVAEGENGEKIEISVAEYILKYI